MRARYPDCDGTVVRDGVEIRYERYGQGRPAILLLPTWSLVHSRHWKMQVAYLARHFTVVCFDGRGSGGSGRPLQPAAYTDAQFASDALAVMDAAGIEAAVLASVSCGALWALRLGAEHPDRVLGAVFIAPTAPLVPPLAERRVQRFGEVLDAPVGWQTYNARYWKTHYPEFVRHENPELKRGQNVWLTDFVGCLPMPDGGEREAFLTTDYNAEMIEHIDRYPWIRDRAIFVGNDDDIVPGTFGGNLPAIRDWTTRHFSYSGYITGFAPPEPGQVAALRAELGYRDDELVCLVAVGGSGVGQALIDKVIAAYPLAKKALPELRMIVVTGPRIDPALYPRGPASSCAATSTGSTSTCAPVTWPSSRAG